jgi:hypothetical protein
MNLVKSPYQILLEQAGLSLDSIPGFANTPQQMMMPHYAPGGSVQQNLSPADMLAAIIVNGQTPQKFAAGSLAKNIGTQAAFALPFMALDAEDIAQDIKNQKYKEAAAKTAGVGYSAFTPFNPLTAFISGLTYSPEVGDTTLDAWKKQDQIRQAQEQYKAALNAQRPQRQAPLTFEETRFYKK